MPSIVSFGWTWPALVAPNGPQKSETRRDWKVSTIARWKAGTEYKAYTKVAYHGGIHIADIVATEAAFLQETACTNGNSSIYSAEGFYYLATLGAHHCLPYSETDLAKAREHALGRSPGAIAVDWAENNRFLAVCRFRVIRVYPEAIEKACVGLADSIVSALPDPESEDASSARQKLIHSLKPNFANPAWQGIEVVR